MPFPFISIAYPIWIAIVAKIFCASISSGILRTDRTAADLMNMVTLVNLVLKRMQKQVSNYARIISSLKKIFRKHFKVFNKFVYAVDEFIKHFSL